MMGFRAITVVLFLVFMATSASANEVTFSGDARVRYIYRDNYGFGNFNRGARDVWDSRVRVNLHAKSKGGAYAKARIRLVDQDWGLDKDRKSSDTFWVDIAYLGIPIGETVVEAGLLKSNITRFFEWDQSADQIQLMWDMFGADWTALFRMADEGQFSIFEVDRVNDNDHQAYALIVKKRFWDTYSAQFAIGYVDDQRDNFVTGTYIPSATGFTWSLFLNGTLEEFEFESEVAFRAADTRQSRDEDGFVQNQLNIDRGDGWGWYVEGAYPIGGFTPILNIGMCLRGFDADNDFGWLMTGNSNNEPIAVISKLGENGDWFWIAPSISYTASEKLSMQANFVFVAVDSDEQLDVDEVLYYERLYELSGELTYKLSDNTAFTWKIGALKPELTGLYKGNIPEEETAFGTYGRLQIRF